MFFLCSQLMKETNKQKPHNPYKGHESSLSLNISQILENSWKEKKEGKELEKFGRNRNSRYLILTKAFFIHSVCFDSSSPNVHHPTRFLILGLLLGATYFKAPKCVCVGVSYNTVLKTLIIAKSVPHPFPTVLECLTELVMAHRATCLPSILT